MKHFYYSVEREKLRKSSSKANLHLLDQTKSVLEAALFETDAGGGVGE